jgi:hypothetical protein
MAVSSLPWRISRNALTAWRVYWILLPRRYSARFAKLRSDLAGLATCIYTADSEGAWLQAENCSGGIITEGYRWPDYVFVTSPLRENNMPAIFRTEDRFAMAPLLN